MATSQEAVPAHLRNLLGKLIHVGIARDFYLGGGTGLALLLHHRRSVDLDFFSQRNNLDFDGRRWLFGKLRRFSGWAVIEQKDGTVHGRLGRVRVSFFWYDVPLVKPFLKREGVPIASLEDIGLMKIAAIIGRGSRKDFYDLYAICQRIPLARLLKLGERKFKNVRDFTLQALKAIAYFQDAQEEPPVVLVKPLAWDKVKSFFTQETRAITKRLVS